MGKPLAIVQSPTFCLALFAWCMLTSLFVHPAASFPDGAPSGACDTLTPRHKGAVTQSNPSTIVLTIASQLRNGSLESVTHYAPNTTYKATLSTVPNPDLFCKGFLIQARRVSTGQVLNHIGAGFTEPAPGSPANYQLSACYPASSGVTHTDRQEKRMISFDWISPPASAGAIQFKYTCVQHEMFFYANLDGPILQPDPSASTDEPLQQHTTQPPPETTTSAGFRPTLFSPILAAMILLVMAALV